MKMRFLKTAVLSSYLEGFVPILGSIYGPHQFHVDEKNRKLGEEDTSDLVMLISFVCLGCRDICMCLDIYIILGGGLG